MKTSGKNDIDKGVREGCPYLDGSGTASCLACSGHYAPSEYQLHEYCRGLNHLKCPFYKTRAFVDGNFAGPFVP